MTDENLTTGAEGAEKPLSNEIMGADSMAAQAGLEEAAHQQDEMAGREEPAGDIVPEATPDSATAMDSVSIIGSAAVGQLEQIFEQRGQNFDSQVSITDIDLDIGRIEILNNENNAPEFMVVYDSDGNNITTAFCREALGIPADDDRITGIIGESAFRYSEIVPNSLSAAGGFNPSVMGNALDATLDSYISSYTSGAKREQLGDTLKRVRSLSSALGKVFAFDDYRHLEVFMAAWLMKDSTCRLSGVPGTGKTTVIECAATLMSNSYGFNTSMRLAPPQDYVAMSDSELFSGNDSGDNIYSPTLLPAGQEYSIIYGNAARPEINDLWESWRFSVWKAPVSRGRQFQYTGRDSQGVPNQITSGAYLYDFKFLQPATETYAKVAIQPESYRKILLQHYYVDVPDTVSLSDENTWPEFQDGLAVIPDGAGKKRLVKPVKLLNSDGSVASFSNQITITKGEKSLTMKLAYSDMDSNKVQGIMADISDAMIRADQGSAAAIAARYISRSGLAGMWSDAGRNEGYWLREFLHHTCYDARANPNALQWKALSAEMLGEIGIAKVDFEKRADEVLYGMEIRETQSFDPAKGANVNTFDFEPVPRPIVTQPVKFFNEANRSKAGMEDAILGLIAERKVEYRGKEFDSPNFVAWMDTNPHQKGNDLAFTDRIDMEILFKSVSMGGRYNIMSNRAGRPVEQLIRNLTMTNALRPLRFWEIRDIWDMIEDDSTGISMKQAGGSYDGYRDVAAISVLFSQAYRTRQDKLPVGATQQDYSWKKNPHESPLVDFSTTTNTTSAQGGGVSAAVLEVGTAAFAANQATVPATALRNQASEVQLPAIFTRVLGFRFTNSIIKLAKSFAFLRGKSYVSRDDIVDAIPYTVAHRIGRSREGLTDTEGNTKGIDKNLAKELRYNSEQEFLREILVRGYINRDVDIGQGGGETAASLLEMLDSFYERCVSILQSSDYAHQYESEVLEVMQRQMSAGNNALGNITTPVHWHIATMVSEAERTGNTVLRNYGDNIRDYPELYENFMQAITTPVGPSMGEACLNDMYALRYQIVNDGNLFSDDKARLVGLCDEEISIYAAGLTSSGRPYLNNTVNSGAAGPFLGNMGVSAELHLPTYGDTLGAWAAITGNTSSDTIQEVAGRLSGLSITGSQYTGNSGHRALSNQQVKLLGRIKDGVLGGSTAEYGRFHQSMSAFSNRMSAKLLSSEGRFIANAANQSGNMACTFNEFMEAARELIKLDEQNTSYDANRTFQIAGTTQAINWSNEGASLMGCFAVPHSELSNFVSGDVDVSVSAGGESRTVSRPARGLTRDKNINMWEDTDNDFLRLWVCLRSVPASSEQPMEEASGNNYMTFIFSATVTSNLAEYHPMEGAEITADTGKITFLPMDDGRAYSSGTVGRGTIGDSGNITKSDRQEYLGILGDALQPRSSR